MAWYCFEWIREVQSLARWSKLISLLHPRSSRIGP